MLLRYLRTIASLRHSLAFLYVGSLLFISPAHAEESWTVLLSMQTGAGVVSHDIASLIRPRFVAAHDRMQLMLSAPLWLTLDDRTAPNSRWQNNWQSADTYAAMIERIHYSSAEGDFSLSVGALTQESFGNAILLDQYTNRIDPIRPRSGLRLDVAGESLRAALLLDSVVDPHIFAADLIAQPFRMLSYDPEGRIELTFEAVADRDAPVRSGRQALAGLSGTLSANVWRTQELAWALYAAGAGLTGMGAGFHTGVRVEMHQPKETTLSARLEYVLAGSRYRPGYFDLVYDIERVGVSAQNDTPKRDIVTPSGGHVRWALDARVRNMRFGLRGDAQINDATYASIYGQYVYADGQVTGMLGQRSILHGRDLFRFDGSTYAMLEASQLIYDGWFVFSALYHLRRANVGVGPSTSTDWVLGAGYGFAAD